MGQRNRPVFARIQARASPIEERRGGAQRRRQLLHGLSGRVAVFAGVLCSVADPRRVLDEARRVLRPGGELRFYEHVTARNARLRRLQRLLDATFWPRLFGGCHTSRDTETTLTASGFAIEERERFSFRPTLLATPVAPRILGRARR